MSNTYIIFKAALCILGSLFLLFSIAPIRRITKKLPKGSLRLKWNILILLILFFTTGYLFYAYYPCIKNNRNDPIEIVVPLIFFFGGIFVLLVGRLASQTAMDMQEIALLQHECNTDLLMKINNRRYFSKRIKEEVSNSLRYSLPLSLLLIDIDYFKNINDSYGHLAGDHVLKDLANHLKHVARESDIIARYGGDEIAIIAPNTNKENAFTLAERLRKIVEESSISLPCADGKDLNITISTGVSILEDQNFKTSKELILETDKSLYQAKEQGRNRVIISPR